VSGFTSTTAGWRSASFNLPATEDKYDLHIEETVGGDTFECRAISIYEYEA
jgi:hypothetical protein